MDGDQHDKGAAQSGTDQRGAFAKDATRAVLGILGVLLLIVLIGRVVPPKGTHSWADIILAVVTAAYVVVTYFQWSALRESIRVARESATAQLEETQRANTLTLRAWLIVENIEPVDIAARRVNVMVQNVGKIPATKIHSCSLFDVDGPLDLEPPDSDIEGGYTIGPDRFHPFTFFIREHEVTDEQLARTEPPPLLRMVARFTYTDALDTEGDTIHCALYRTNPAPHFVDWPYGCSVS